MFKITSNAKHGGIWDAASKRVVKEFETDNATLAEQFKAQGCIVEEVEVTLDKLNVAQLKKYAKDNGIPVGPGRGSGAAAPRPDFPAGPCFSADVMSMSNKPRRFLRGLFVNRVWINLPCSRSGHRSFVRGT